jgi:EAL domain-containing protein (putative c-di-GMP-specific phosphodiesterase class I)/serine phosphatase RsbU (regulator of sigma subunit)
MHAIIHLERRLMIRGLREYQERTAAELEIARQMQEALLPDAEVIRKIQDQYGIDIAAQFKPSDELGGDLWGVWPIDASRIGIFVGDVSGHGTIAAIDTFRVHIILTRNDCDRSDPGPFLSAVNDRLTGILSPDQFVTMLYAVLDIRQDRLSYAAAGCPDPLVVLPSVRLHGLDGSGLPLGVTGGVQYPTRQAPFTPGSHVVLHSDAFPEARMKADGTLLGDERAQALVAEALASNDPREIVAKLFGQLTDDSVSLDDDLTLICISRPGVDVAPAGGQVPAAETKTRGRVLAVTNTVSQRLTVKQVAASAGMEADGASDLATAGRFLAGYRYDALVVDLQLPPDERLELFRTIAGTGSSSRLILLGSQSDDIKALAASLRLEVTATLPMPLEAQPLRQALLASPAKRDSTSRPESRVRVTEADLTRALAENEVTFGFQPQLSLGAGRIVCAEALVRWNSPQHGIIPTDVFLSLITDGGATAMLSDLTLRAAATACAGWRASLPSMRVAINLSAMSLQDPSLLALVQHRLQDAGVPPTALVVEVAETDAIACMATLAALRGLGCCVALDEASGNSTVQMLERLPIDMLKLGRPVVRHCDADASSMRVLNATVAVARALGLSVAAVGVESHAVEQALRAAGCDTAQGWLYGPALSAEAIRKMLS